MCLHVFTELLPCEHRATTMCLHVFTELLICSPSGQTVCSHKSRVKKFLLEYQSEGDPEDWHSSNNILVNISGPRKSARNVT